MTENGNDVMQCINAVAVSSGIAFGEIYKVKNVKQEWDTSPVYDAKTQHDRFNTVKNQVLFNLSEMYDNTKSQVGNETAKIFDFHKEIVQDDIFIQCVRNQIDEGYCLEYAVNEAGKQYSDVIMQTRNEYLIARCSDVLDVCSHILSCLVPDKKRKITINKPCILAIEELTPSIVITLDSSNILGVIEQKGSKQSHSAILMNALSIPSVCQLGVRFNMINEKDRVILDGTNGMVISSYDETTYDKYYEKFCQEKDKHKIYSQHQAYNTQLINSQGKHIKINANVFSLLEIDILVELSSRYPQKDGKTSPVVGVGLFRSEFLYMGLSRLPSEDYQYNIYKKLLSKTSNMYNGKGCEVTIRTLDIGGDKILPYDIGLTDSNLRGVEFSLLNIDVFKTQIRALYMASSYGKLSILIPMVTTVQQIIQVKAVINEAKSELDSSGVVYAKEIPLGVMIETPQAALNSDILAKNCDFFCIGTNDLAALTLKVDRFNNEANNALDFSDIKVMEMVKKTVQNAAKNNIPCSICGNSAYDSELVPQYIAMGITDFSVPVNQILPLNHKIKQVCIES